MTVSVQVAADVARTLHGQAPASDSSRELSLALDELGVTLTPVYPGAEDRTLEWFTIDVSDPVTAARVVSRLQGLAGVATAYFKPPDEMP